MSRSTAGSEAPCPCKRIASSNFTTHTQSVLAYCSLLLPCSDILLLATLRLHLLRPRLTFIVACFAFIVDFSQEVLVVCELFLVHATHLAPVGFLFHLAAEELLVVLINARDLAIQALLLELVVLLIRLPDHGLLVVQGLLSLFALLLLLHLAAKQIAHLLLLEAVTLHATLVLQARTHLLLLLEAKQGLLLATNTILLFGDNIAGERVHEVLGAGFASTELAQTIRLLLIKHLTVFKLRLHIRLDFSLPLVVG